MTTSYRRGCRTCGRPIQLRRMPGGQWVAFEGFDTPHKCHGTAPPKASARTTAPGAPTPAASPPPRPDPSGLFADLDFLDVEVRRPAAPRPISPERPPLPVTARRLRAVPGESGAAAPYREPNRASAPAGDPGFGGGATSPVSAPTPLGRGEAKPVPLPPVASPSPLARRDADCPAAAQARGRSRRAVGCLPLALAVVAVVVAWYFAGGLLSPVVVAPTSTPERPSATGARVTPTARPVLSSSAGRRAPTATARPSPTPSAPWQARTATAAAARTATARAATETARQAAFRRSAARTATARAATETAARRTPTPLPILSLGLDPSGDRDCGDFSTHAQAQSAWEAAGGSATNNLWGLDRDGDGVACETLP